MKHLGTIPIKTERLILRRFALCDSTAMFRNWAGNPNVTRYLTWDAHRSEEESMRLLENWLLQYRKKNFYEWAIESKELKEPIGSIGAVQIMGYRTFEAGYCLGEPWWGQGLASEAFEAVIRFLFDQVQCKKIVAKYAERNLASMRVLQKAGMRPTNREVYLSTDEGFFACPVYELKSQWR